VGSLLPRVRFSAKSYRSVGTDAKIGLGCTLQVGTADELQAYEEECTHPTAEAAQEAVCKRALELNVEGFMTYIKDTLSPAQQASSITHEQLNNYANQ